LRAPMNRLHDPAILALPHPVRIDAALGPRAEEVLLAQMGVLEGVRPHLTDERASTEWIINEGSGREPPGLDSPGAGQRRRGLRAESDRAACRALSERRGPSRRPVGNGGFAPAGVESGI
jgi:hypothetical protein